MLASIPEFIGHLHPVLVHLPIGILLLACLFLWQSRKDKFANLQRPINTMLLLGMISAIASCITGYVLSQRGEYDTTLVGWHQWMGISVAVVSVLTYYFRRKASLRKWQWVLASLLLLLIFITGHLGGSLTHGTDYLTEPLETGFENETGEIAQIKPIPDVEQAFVYADIIQPIFHRTCTGCHGPTRQKGKLRLDGQEMIMKGGKDGAVIKPGQSGESELIKRILLPREDEHHMAPKEKRQLEGREIILLRWWIDQGADFLKKVKDLSQPDSVRAALLSLQSPETGRVEDDDIPAAPIALASQGAIDTLRKNGVLLLPLAQNSHYLEANYLTADTSRDRTLGLLRPLKDQLLRLKLSNYPVNDSALAAVAQCRQLRKLYLDHTHISDSGLRYLAGLDSLKYLNLAGTRVTARGLVWLKGLKKLQELYLYQTDVSRNEWPRLVKQFPNTRLDSGGYHVPFLQTDTMVVKPPKPQK